MSDLQNVVVRNGVNGDLATTSYGPRSTNKTTASSRPASMVKRTALFQLDGDVAPATVADFDNDTLFALPAGCFILSAYAVSPTGAAVTLQPVDAAGNMGAIVALAPGAGAWVAVRDLDISTSDKTQFNITIGAGEVAEVVVEFLQTETTVGSIHGVLAKAE